MGPDRPRIPRLFRPPNFGLRFRGHRSVRALLLASLHRPPLALALTSHPISLAVLFLVSYLGSLGVLVKRRRAEGRMWSASVFGLGRDAASVNASGLRGAPSAWNGSGGLPEMDEEATPGGSEVKLMAWNR